MIARVGKSVANESGKNHKKLSPSKDAVIRRAARNLAGKFSLSIAVNQVCDLHRRCTRRPFLCEKGDSKKLNAFFKDFKLYLPVPDYASMQVEIFWLDPSETQIQINSLGVTCHTSVAL